MKGLLKSVHIQSMPLEVLQRHDGKRFFMRGGEHDGRCDAGLERFAPASCTYAPSVARLQSGKAEVGLRRGQIVALRFGEGEELGRHARTDDVQAQILRTGVAATVAIEAGARALRTWLQ